MDFKKICFLMLISSLLIGSAYASDVTSFNMDKTLKQTFNDSYHSLYLNDNHDSGVAIYKNVDDDLYDNDHDNDDVDDCYDNLIEDDGREYLHSDEDYQVNKKSDNTASFKDYDNNEHGIVELIKKEGQEYIIVFWTKNNNNITNKDLKTQLKQFNKNNNATPIAF